MTLKEAQEAVDKWISTYGVRYFNELTNMANQTGIDLEKSFQKNLQKKQQGILNVINKMIN